MRTNDPTRSHDWEQRLPDALLGPPVSTPDAELSMARLAERLTESPAAPPASRISQSKQRRTGSPFRVVQASIAMGVVVAAGYAIVQHVDSHRNPLAASHTTASTTYTTYATKNAQHATITLADGSTVLLDDASTLMVPTTFGTRTRTVIVNGRAKITVQHAGALPFTARIGGADVRVLGTAFTVRHYAGDRAVQVVVSSGKVALQTQHRSPSAARSVILTDRMLGEITDSGTVTVTPDIALAEYTGWTNGQLVFDKSPLPIALREIERRYNLTINLADSSVARQHLTATIASESASEVLDILALTLQLRYTRSGPGARVVTFTPASSPVRRIPIRPTFTPEIQYGR